MKLVEHVGDPRHAAAAKEIGLVVVRNGLRPHETIAVLANMCGRGEPLQPPADTMTERK